MSKPFSDAGILELITDVQEAVMAESFQAPLVACLLELRSARATLAKVREWCNEFQINDLTSGIPGSLRAVLDAPVDCTGGEK